MADTLEDSHLIVVDAINAGCSGVSQCADELITDYLVDLDLPAAAETDCLRNSDRQRSTIGSSTKHEVAPPPTRPQVCSLCPAQRQPPRRPRSDEGRRLRTWIRV